ncbi:MAG: hypothetical protein IPM31_08285 [Anaerolineae bacterium]|nr:hypothetical protein [Anaerolineae bacterium]MBL8104545.1 hypothetical protein [Anaerolineales bacterium]MCC7187917.1 hypothetical protein [Anaerolineales bacterium]
MNPEIHLRLAGLNLQGIAQMSLCGIPPPQADQAQTSTVYLDETKTAKHKD